MEKERKEIAEKVAKDLNLKEGTQMYVCMADDMHPYNCDGMFGGRCIHCEAVKSEDHDPDTCALCKWDEETTPKKDN